MMRVVLLCMVVPSAGGLAAQSEGFDFFERKIRPVLVERCYQCHSAESEKLKAELRLDTAEGMHKGGKSGKPAIVPHGLAASVLLGAISYTNADLQMPPKKQLPANVVEDFVAWVNMGAPDPRTNGAPAIVRATDHWAFKPVKAPKLPEVKDTSWPRNEIDYFILQKLEEKGLRPAPDADEHTLIRRAYFTLHGLPPSQGQQWPGLIDQLLASPRYGERWARHWLDVARYSDTKGYVYSDREEPRFVYSHTYRDWVIEALNRDLPYDQFLKLQIAADQMNCDRKDLAAMGFLTLGRRFLGVVHDIIDDRIDVLTRGTQGLTVSCARCHDHKFDPISTQDYYSLYGVFQASTESIVPIGAGGTAPSLDPHREGAVPPAPSYEKELRKRSQEVTNAFEKTKEDLANHLRKKTTDYLLAQKTAHLLPSEEFYEILGPDELNPVFVRQWQHYIQQRPKDDPIFGAWHRQGKTAETDNPLVQEALAKATTMDDVARAYGELFVRIHKKWQETKKVDPDEEPLRQVLYDEDGPAYPPKGSYVDQQFFFDEGGRVKLAKLLRDIDVLNITHPMALPHAGILEDKPEIHNPRVFKRGNPVNRGEEVPRQYLEVVSGKQRKPFTRGSGRLEMAEIIASIDPENRLLSHMNRQRLDFEAMHDFLLAASGELNCKMGGPGVKLFSRPAARERAVYGYIDRQFLPSVYRTFDFANPDLHTPLRHLTSVPQQSLFFMNSPFVVERAQALTAELGEGEAAVRQLYNRLFQRTPSEHEIQRALDFVKGVEPPSPPPTNPPPAWQYGVGEIDESGALQAFTPFPHFTGDTWQGSEFHPDPRLGPAQLKADAGYPGDDNKHAVVRRWIAPSNCVLRISGTLSHEAKEGDGIRAYIVIGSKRPVASWTLRAQKAETTIEDVAVKAGETIDFAVACGKDSSNDTFKWAPKVGSWDAKADFAGPSEPPLKPLDAWAAFAQVLFFSNEFMFID